MIHRNSVAGVIAAAILFGSAARAQTAVSMRTQAKDVDFSKALSTRPAKSGTTLPATCSVGEQYFKTDAPAGQNLYGCYQTDSWALLGGQLASFFGRTGDVTPQAGDYTAAQVTDAVDSTQVYANPSWLGSISWNIVRDAPSFAVISAGAGAPEDCTGLARGMYLDTTATRNALWICASSANVPRNVIDSDGPGPVQISGAEGPPCANPSPGQLCLWYDAADHTAKLKDSDGNVYIMPRHSGAGSRLEASDLADGTTGGGSVVRSDAPTLLNPSFGSGAGTVPVPNDSLTGTALNKLAKLTGAPSSAIISATTDTTGIVGVVVSGAGTAGNAEIARIGKAICAFDGPTVAGNYVQVSSTVAGDCHDAGSTSPLNGQILGFVLQSIDAAGDAPVLLRPDMEASAGGPTSGPTLPATCTIGAQHILTAQYSSSSFAFAYSKGLYTCVASNTWAAGPGYLGPGETWYASTFGDASFSSTAKSTSMAACTNAGTASQACTVYVVQFRLSGQTFRTASIQANLATAASASQYVAFGIYDSDKNYIAAGRFTALTSVPNTYNAVLDNAATLSPGIYYLAWAGESTTAQFYGLGLATYWGQMITRGWPGTLRTLGTSPNRTTGTGTGLTLPATLGTISINTGLNVPTLAFLP